MAGRARDFAATMPPVASSCATNAALGAASDAKNLPVLVLRGWGGRLCKGLLGSSVG
jgi:hypothetical protein